MKTIPIRLAFFCTLLVLGVLRAGLPTARAQETLARTTVHRFAGSEGSTPSSLILGADGNFYGTTSYGGNAYVAGQPASGSGTVYRLSPAGDLTVLYSFTGGSDGANPQGLIQGADGNLYGLTSSGGVNGLGTVFRLTTAGALTTIYSQNGAALVYSLVQGPDGNLYGTGFGSDSTPNMPSNPVVFRLTLAGEYTILHSFTGGDHYGTLLGLVLAGDGNLYGVIDTSHLLTATVYRLKLDGTFDSLHVFSGTNESEANGLTIGRDGNLYGTVQIGGTNYDGFAYRFTLAGEYTPLYSFSPADSNFPVNALVLGGDGNFYGVTYGDASGSVPSPSKVFRLTPSGEVTYLYASATTVGTFVAGPNGSFYGIQSSESNPGEIFKLTTVPHPAFFTGQAPLLNGVEYLAFPNGNYFGYYAFLSDPNYLYHYDLGYEYVFDAADGAGGVYLYDFASGSFFYTSPTFGFPYLYDFSLNAVLYYYPDPDHADRYNTDGTRYFYNFATGQIISK